MIKLNFVRVLVAVSMSLLTMSYAWAIENEPKAIIEDTLFNIVKILEEREDSSSLTDSDREKIRQVVKGRFDYREMSRRSIGKVWKDISEDEKAEFTELFRKLLERSYGNRLATFHGQKVICDTAEYRKDKARVKTRVVDIEKEIPIEYRLHQTVSGWQVYDIKVEGVSLVSNFRKDFKSGLKRYGGFAGLKQALQEKVEKLSAKDQT